MAENSLKIMQNADIQYLSQVHKTLSQNPDASQRELASSTNLSLGMTNALLKRYSDKGWLYMKKISARNIKYVLTSEGMNKLVERSTQYFDRTARLVKNYKDVVYSVIQNSGCEKVYLVGKTDLEFLFDFACSSLHIDFEIRDIVPEYIENEMFVVCSKREDFEAMKQSMAECNVAFIEDLLRVCEYETM